MRRPLAYMYLHGIGVKQSTKRAIKYLEQSLELHYAPAGLLLGDLYHPDMRMDDVANQPADQDIALQHYISVTEIWAHPEACYQAGLIYFAKGKLEQAAEYLNIAAINGHSSAIAFYIAHYNNLHPQTHDLADKIKNWLITLVVEYNIKDIQAIRDGLRKIEEEHESNPPAKPYYPKLLHSLVQEGFKELSNERDEQYTLGALFSLYDDFTKKISKYRWADEYGYQNGSDTVDIARAWMHLFNEDTFSKKRWGRQAINELEEADKMNGQLLQIDEMEPDLIFRILAGYYLALTLLPPSIIGDFSKSNAWSNNNSIDKACDLLEKYRNIPLSNAQYFLWAAKDKKERQTYLLSSSTASRKLNIALLARLAVSASLYNKQYLHYNYFSYQRDNFPNLGAQGWKLSLPNFNSEEQVSLDSENKRQVRPPIPLDPKHNPVEMLNKKLEKLSKKQKQKVFKYAELLIYGLKTTAEEIKHYHHSLDELAKSIMQKKAASISEHIIVRKKGIYSKSNNNISTVNTLSTNSILANSF